MMNRDNFPKVSPGEFSEILNDIWRLPNKDRPAVCLWGDPGLGKTSCVQAWGNSVNTICVSTFSEPADILGMPEKTSAGTTRMLKPDWVTIKPSSDHKGYIPSGDTKPAHKNVYLFDDFNRANNLVLNALMPLLLFKKTQSWKLNPSALIVLTANFPDKTNLANLQSFTDQAIQERFLNFECKFGGAAFKSWMSWAQDQDGLSQKGLSWLKQEPEIMSSGRGRNPRTITRFLTLIQPIPESDLKDQFDRVKLLAQGAGIDDILIKSFESFVFGKQKKKLFTSSEFYALADNFNEIKRRIEYAIMGKNGIEMGALSTILDQVVTDLPAEITSAQRDSWLKLLRLDLVPNDLRVKTLNALSKTDLPELTEYLCSDAKLSQLILEL